MKEMHPPNVHSNQDDDNRIRELLSPLRKLVPRREATAANRIAVAEELERVGFPMPGTELRWWQQSVSIRIPAAVCLAVLVLAVVGVQEARIRGWGRLASDERTTLDPLVSGTMPSEPVNSANAQNDDGASLESSDELEYSASATYLCGIGTLETESVYTFAED